LVADGADTVRWVAAEKGTKTPVPTLFLGGNAQRVFGL
jgi:hypothetical protein